MTVSESDALDLAARFRGDCDQAIGGSAERRVNEREAIVLADEVDVNRAETGELKQVTLSLVVRTGPSQILAWPVGILRFSFLPA